VFFPGHRRGSWPERLRPHGGVANNTVRRRRLIQPRGRQPLEVRHAHSHHAGRKLRPLADDTFVDGVLGPAMRAKLVTTGTYSNTILSVKLSAR
jgi:hypothetical protein